MLRGVMEVAESSDMRRENKKLCVRERAGLLRRCDFAGKDDERGREGSTVRAGRVVASVGVRRPAAAKCVGKDSHVAVS